ncbi:hypothetical protein CRM22_011099 [Opisthorchis felineus]|uniref:Uncharacterized protein n=1 Tax=Opisthorchis felineus TaxID=147828 RepID=A0A4S2KBB3_OPIFE|nr:hypothetical protein CRM22_011098 [Opisthorchis felineus]TGZ46593.1 hypothetical protein CRM22_011099 [Opisthorchis felineus]
MTSKTALFEVVVNLSVSCQCALSFTQSQPPTFDSASSAFYEPLVPTKTKDAARKTQAVNYDGNQRPPQRTISAYMYEQTVRLANTCTTNIFGTQGETNISQSGKCSMNTQLPSIRAKVYCRLSKTTPRPPRAAALLITDADYSPVSTSRSAAHLSPHSPHTARNIHLAKEFHVTTLSLLTKPVYYP